MRGHVTDHVIFRLMNCWRHKEAAIKVRTNRKIEAPRGGKCVQQNYIAPFVLHQGDYRECSRVNL